jgi:glucosamine--fructose-6-phosphate aminotransferase (isomerizing)
LAKAAAKLGSAVIPIVQEGDRAISGAYENAIEIPPVDEQLSPYLTIIPLYLFAYYASLIRGYNPDYLRYLTPRYWETRTIIFPPGTH